MAVRPSNITPPYAKCTQSRAKRAWCAHRFAPSRVCISGVMSGAPRPLPRSRGAAALKSKHACSRLRRQHGALARRSRASVVLVPPPARAVCACTARSRCAPRSFPCAPARAPVRPHARNARRGSLKAKTRVRHAVQGQLLALHRMSERVRFVAVKAKPYGRALRGLDGFMNCAAKEKNALARNASAAENVLLGKISSPPGRPSSFLRCKAAVRLGKTSSVTTRAHRCCL